MGSSLKEFSWRKEREEEERNNRMFVQRLDKRRGGGGSKSRCGRVSGWVGGPMQILLGEFGEEEEEEEV